MNYNDLRILSNKYEIVDVESRIFGYVINLTYDRNRVDDRR